MSLPVYAMSCFKLPKDTCKRITSAMVQFWWNNEKDRRKIPWVAWKSLCRSKEVGGLGFRDIERFNQALLGMQAWRIWNNPSSLLAQILKHRYFKNKTFMDCGAGPRPSFAWRSILFGRYLLQKGLLKRIGNGLNTKVWSENWLVDTPPRPPATSQFIQVRDDELKVADLWYPNSCIWNTHLLRRTFTEQDAEIISRIRPNPTSQDELIWNFSTNGCYTTQSGYKFSQRIMEIEDQQLPITTPLEKRQWSRIWKMRTTSKIRHFMWKTSKGALSVADRLQTRGLYTDLICSSCNTEVETICHVLFTCRMASQAWCLAQLPLPQAGFSQSSIFLNLHHMLRCCDRADINPNLRRAFPWVLWNIWKARNIFCFEKKRLAPENVVHKSQEEADEWFFANFPSIPSEAPIALDAGLIRKWLPPLPGFTKCNIGSSWVGAHRNCGVAWLLRDNTGKPIFHSRRAYSLIRSSLSADLLSLWWAVENLTNLRQQKVIFETSSLQVIEAIQFPNRFHEFSEIIEGIHNLLQLFVEWKVNHSPRWCNSPALKIARSVTEDRRFHSYIAQGGPIWLRDLISSEASSSP